MKKLIPALCLLLISAILMGTSTYAWFSMNTTVTATNMKVKAVAEQGILINEVPAANSPTWDNEATTNQATAGIQLRATSTATTATWFTATSKKANSAAAASETSNSEDLNGGYTTLSLNSSTIQSAAEGVSAQQDVYFVDANGNSTYDDGEGYYAKYTYYLKSSAGALTLSTAAKSQTVNISKIEVSGNTNSADLDKSLRVAVVVNSKAYIFAPLNTSAGTYYVGTNHTATTPLNHTVSQPTALTSLPATTAPGTAVYVYLYFEGEDANLKTDSITSTLDNLTVNVAFSLVTNDSAVTDSGVAVA